MSGTDYTLTPNLNLYKPLPNADINGWGAHLNSNADMLDTALHSVQTAGPFLPLSGGAMQGNVAWPGPGMAISVYGAGSHIEALCFLANIGTTITYSGAPTQYQYGFLFTGNLTGSAAPNTNANYITVASDTATLPAGAQGLSWFSVQGNVGNGGSASSGNRAAISSELAFIGPCTGAPADRQWQAHLATFQSGANAGGTAPTGSSADGMGYAGGDQAWLKSGATNWFVLCGREVDVGIFTGASAATRVGLHVVSYGNVHGTDYDQGLSVSAVAGAPGFLHGLALNGGSVDAINGTAIACYGSASAHRGIDLTAWTFSDSVFCSPGGFTIGPTGAVSFGQNLATSNQDLSKHITLFNDGTHTYGLNVTSGVLGFVSSAWWSFNNDAGTTMFYVNNSGGTYAAGGLGVFGTTPPTSKPTVTGAKGSNAALASLMTALAAYGLVTDTTTA